MIRYTRCAFVATVSLAFSAACSFAQDAEWKAGFASARITPQVPLMLSGYASRTAPFTEVLDDLHMKALALEDAQGARVLIVTADLIGFAAEVSDPIRERIASATKVPKECILLNASHTHTGPTLLAKRREGSTMTEEQSTQSMAYTKFVQDTCVKLAAEALGRLNVARISLGSGVVNFPMNRREFTDKGVILGVNPRGPVDRGVSVLRIESPDGRLMGVLFRASCHNTTFGSKDNQISGDFAGNAQSFIERELPGATAMFMQGFAGDTNPYPNSLNDPTKRPAAEIARAHGADLGREVVRVLNGKLKPVHGPLRTAYGTADLPLEKRPSKAELEKLAAEAGSWKKWVAGRMLAEATADQPVRSHYPTSVSLWQFGNDLTMVGLSGEVVVDYARLIEEAVGPLNLWLAAYCHDTFGYIPSARVIREGGYETRGLYSGGVGYFAPEAERVLVDKVRELAKQAGRTEP
jgi:neutral ceramidase